jgi:hypothetical protein
MKEIKTRFLSYQSIECVAVEPLHLVKDSDSYVSVPFIVMMHDIEQPKMSQGLRVGNIH